MNDEIPIVHPEPNPFWKDNAQKLVSESISTIEEVAKQLIALNSLLEGIYFSAISFSEIKPGLSGIAAAIYLTPILLWILSLVFAVLTLSPKSYEININSSSDSKEKFNKIISKKHAMLMWSEVLLILSFIALFAAVAYYLVVVP